MLLLLLGYEQKGVVQSHLQWSNIWALSQLQLYVATTGFKCFDDEIKTCLSAEFSETSEMSFGSFNCLRESCVLSSPDLSFLHLRGSLCLQLSCPSLQRDAISPCEGPEQLGWISLSIKKMMLGILLFIYLNNLLR